MDESHPLSGDDLSRDGRGQYDDLVRCLEYASAIISVRRLARVVAVLCLIPASLVFLFSLIALVRTEQSSGVRDILALVLSGGALALCTVTLLRPSPRLAMAVAGLIAASGLLRALHLVLSEREFFDAAMCAFFALLFAGAFFRARQSVPVYDDFMARLDAAHLVKETKRLIKSVLKSSEERDHRVVSFARVTFVDRHYYRGLLLDDGHLILVGAGLGNANRNAVVLDRGDVGIVEAPDKRRKPRQLKVTMRIGSEEFKAEMSDVSLRRLEMWTDPAVGGYSSQRIAGN